MNAPVFVVNVGFDSRGRARNRLFLTLDGARDFCTAVHARTGIVLSILVRGSK